MIEKCPFCGKETFYSGTYAEPGCDHFAYIAKNGECCWNSSPHGDDDQVWGKVDDDPLIFYMSGR